MVPECQAVLQQEMVQVALELKAWASHDELQSNHHHQHRFLTGRMPFLIPSHQQWSTELHYITLHIQFFVFVFKQVFVK